MTIDNEQLTVNNGRCPAGQYGGAAPEPPFDPVEIGDDVGDDNHPDATRHPSMEGNDPETPFDLDDDILSFKKAFPHVRLDRLVTTPAFLSFGKHRFGVEPFAEIYRDYSELVKAIETEALAKRARRSERSTGGGQSAPYTGLTREQSEQLETWNKAYPHLKMTPREFLSK